MAARRLPHDVSGFVARSDQPLIGVLEMDGDDPLVTYYTDAATADETLDGDDIHADLLLAGAWSDMEWDELEAGLHQIRHESTPTPPLAP